jgi:hypothetical protein
MAKPGKSVIAVVGVFAAVAVGAGIGEYVVHSRQSDRDNQIAAIKLADTAHHSQVDAPVTAGVRADGSHYGALFAYLLPTPDGWSLGSDVSGMGDNTYLDQSHLNAHLQSELLRVPKSDLSSTESTLSDLHLQAIAVRSMVKPDQTMQVSIELMQMDPKKAAADQKSVSDLVDGFGFRQGASVPGYPNASCVLPPGLGSDKVDFMTCFGSYGDIEVAVQVDGTAPLDQSTAVQMMAQQLDRLKTGQTLTVNSPDQGDQNE